MNQPWVQLPYDPNNPPASREGFVVVVASKRIRAERLTAHIQCPLDPEE